jgi:16S rRNA (uracil1498-N3)-methyltransferase
VAIHRVFSDEVITDDVRTLSIGGEQAHHAARVKRVERGDTVEVLDGHGVIARCLVSEVAKVRGEMVLTLTVEQLRRCAPPVPHVSVASATPKADRASWMVEQLAQVGCAAWSPLETKLGVVDPREGKIDRFHRVAAESSKQCGRPWIMDIGEKLTLARCLRGGDNTQVVMADASGREISQVSAEQGQRLAGGIRFLVLVGPEGGWMPEELAAAGVAGVPVLRVGEHIMRIETAAVAAVVALMTVAPRTAK